MRCHWQIRSAKKVMCMLKNLSHSRSHKWTARSRTPRPSLLDSTRGASIVLIEETDRQAIWYCILSRARSFPERFPLGSSHAHITLAPFQLEDTVRIQLTVTMPYVNSYNRGSLINPSLEAPQRGAKRSSHIHKRASHIHRASQIYIRRVLIHSALADGHKKDENPQTHALQNVQSAYPPIPFQVWLLRRSSPKMRSQASCRSPWELTVHCIPDPISPWDHLRVA